MLKAVPCPRWHYNRIILSEIMIRRTNLVMRANTIQLKGLVLMSIHKGVDN